MNDLQGPLEEPAGDWFVNRTEALNIFWKWATGIPHPGRRSYALIGLRRTGKTAILHKLFNRIYHEQTEVMPVYISFASYLHRQRPINAYEFVAEFFSGYLRCYVAFRYKRPELFGREIELDYLIDLASQYDDEIIAQLMKEYRHARFGELSSVYGLVHWTISVPHGTARQYQIPTALIIDEFQVLTWVYNPDSQQYNDVTNGFQRASEMRWAPMLVSGSSVSMMVDETLGGMLSGRFNPLYLGPLTQEHTLDMVYRLGRRNGIEVTEALALEIWQLTEGYPYPIECLLNSDSPEVANLPKTEALEEVLLYELRQRGSLWNHYEQVYGKIIHEMNGDQTARKVLLFTTKDAHRRLFAHDIATDLGLDEQKVREALALLYKADVLDQAGTLSYWGPKDPMLRRYIQYDHKVEIDHLAPEVATEDLRTEINRVQGEANRVVGHLAEIMVGGVMRGFDGREVDGPTYFSIAGSITLPRLINLERREGVIKAGAYNEIDLIGEYRLPQRERGAWLVSVRYRQQKMGPGEIEKFLGHCEVVQAEKGYMAVTRWYFSKAGFTEPALDLLEAEGLYFSDLAQVNALAQVFGFLGIDP